MSLGELAGKILRTPRSLGLLRGGIRRSKDLAVGYAREFIFGSASERRLRRVVPPSS